MEVLPHLNRLEVLKKEMTGMFRCYAKIHALFKWPLSLKKPLDFFLIFLKRQDTQQFCY